MRRADVKSFLVPLSAAAMIAGCMSNDAAQPSASARANLNGPDGGLLARSTITGAADGMMRVSVEAAGLRPGTYAVHVHMIGRCDAPAFESAGAHWNPTNRQHGTQNPQGKHQGDLPNLLVGANGAGSIAYVVRNARVTGGATPLLDADGAAVLVHAQPDDYRTDPSGNSGARIACGVLG